jgi:4-hydroxy-tetrahydrodipicolinate synthase
LPILSLGGKGVISVFANILPKVMKQICADYLSGNVEASRTTFLKYLELMDALFWDVNPIPIKAAMNFMGFECGPCRLPLTNMSKELSDKLYKVLQKYEVVQ